MFARFIKPANVGGRMLPITVGSAVLGGAGYAYNSYSVLNQGMSLSTIYNDTGAAGGGASAAAALFQGDGRWVDVTIDKIEQLSHDTRKFTFKLPSEDYVSGLTTASCLLAKYVTEKGSNVIRPYTPVSEERQRGYFELVIKHYEGGKFTSHLFGLKENDKVQFKGPILKFHWQPNQFDSITLLGAGTGITPLFQLLRKIANDKNDRTKVHLVYGNKTVDDILLKKELDDLAAQYPDQIKVSYFVDNAPLWGFKGSKGFISKSFLQKNIPGPKEDTHVFVCGPAPFMDAYSGQKTSPTDQGELKGLLAELGYSKDQVFKF